MQMCVCKGFKSPCRTIWVQRSPLEAIYYGWPLQGSDLCFCTYKGFASFWPATPPWPEAGRPLSGKRSSLQPSPQPNGYSMAVSDRLYFTTNSFKRRNRPWFVVYNHSYQFSEWDELARSYWGETWTSGKISSRIDSSSITGINTINKPPQVEMTSNADHC